MKRLFFVLTVVCFIFGFGIVAFACDETQNDGTYDVQGNLDHSIARYLPNDSGQATQFFNGSFSGNQIDSDGYISLTKADVYAKPDDNTLEDGTIMKSRYTATDFIMDSYFKKVDVDLDFKTEIGSVSELGTEDRFAKASHSGGTNFDYQVTSSDLVDLNVSTSGNGYTSAWQSEDSKYTGAETSSIMDFNSTLCVIPEITNSGIVEVQIIESSCDDFINTHGLASYDTGAGVRATAYADTFNSGVIKTDYQTSVSAFVRAKITKTQ